MLQAFDGTQFYDFLVLKMISSFLSFDVSVQKCENGKWKTKKN